MSQFEYVTVLTSFVVAVGVSDLLSGWGRLYLHRASVAMFPLQLAASALLLLALLQSIWGYWGFRDVAWNFGGFLLALSPLLPVVAAAHLITPPATGSSGQPADPETHYHSVFRAIFTLLATWVALGVVAELFLAGPDLHFGQLVRGLAIVLLLALRLTSNTSVHWAGLVLLALLQVAFIGTVTPALE
ncbi:MAG: hypothetical protein AAF430_18230 [Myxococcota bacterium]